MTRTNLISTWHGHGILALGLLVGGVALGADGASAASPGRALPSPTILHVDCGQDGARSARPGGRGSVRDPIRDLGTLNARRLAPGTRVRFRRGSVCHGVFRPAEGSSGIAGAPILAEAYGDPRAGRPVIAAGCRAARRDPDQALTEAAKTRSGISNYFSLCLSDDKVVNPAAVHLRNVEYWEIRDLELTNDALSPGARMGLLVELSDFGTGRHYVVDNVYVHHVRGQLKNEGKGDAFVPGKTTGGIQFRVSRPAPRPGITPRPTRFEGIRVENSEIYAVDLIGLSIWSDWMCRPTSPMCKDYRPYNMNYSDRVEWTPAAYSEWFPSTDVAFRNNLIHNVGGDAVIVRVSRDALVESNLAYDVWMRAAGNSAGLWAINADGTLFRYNEVHHVRLQHNIEPGDGMAFDADMGTIGTRFTANYSHDNEGGMVLFCGCAENEGKRAAETIGTLVDANFSLNDGRRSVAAAGSTASVVRGNYIVNTTGRNSPVLENIAMPAPPDPNQVRFEGNHFYNLAGTSEVVRLKNKPGAFTHIEWVGNRFTGGWKDNVPGGLKGEGNAFVKLANRGTAPTTASLFQSWARSTGFLHNRYRGRPGRAGLDSQGRTPVPTSAP